MKAVIATHTRAFAQAIACHAAGQDIIEKWMVVRCDRDFSSVAEFGLF